MEPVSLELVFLNHVLYRFAFTFTIQLKKASPEMIKYGTIGICLADAYSNKRDT